MNLTPVGTVRSTLLDTKLPKHIWKEASSSAAYMRNRSLTKAVERMTQLEVWIGEKPNIDHLSIFGCIADDCVAKIEQHKLYSKAWCIFLGYGTETKGYPLYDPQRDRVFYNRYVLFNELSYGVEKEPDEQKEKRYITIDSSSDKEPAADDIDSPLRRF